MPAAFYLVDRQWRFRFVNAMAERLMHRSRAELLGRSLWRTFPGMAGSAFESAYRAAVDSGEPVAFESGHTGPDDRWFEVRAWPEPDGLAVWFLDVTDRRRAEEAAGRAAARTSLLARLAAELSGARDGVSALTRLARAGARPRVGTRAAARGSQR